MPRKPKLEKKTITVVVNGTPIAVTLHPPAGARKSLVRLLGGPGGKQKHGAADP